MRQAALDIRYAFERDMVRRGTFPRNAGIIEECVECKQDFDRTVPNQVVCDGCRAERVRRQTRERVRKHRARRVEPEYEFTMVDRDNLVSALIRACVQEMLRQYVDTREVAHTGVTPEDWLTEFAEPYMAAVGEHINIDQILEEIDERTTRND